MLLIATPRLRYDRRDGVAISNTIVILGALSFRYPSLLSMTELKAFLTRTAGNFAATLAQQPSDQWHTGKTKILSRFALHDPQSRRTDKSAGLTAIVRHRNLRATFSRHHGHRNIPVP